MRRTASRAQMMAPNKFTSITSRMVAELAASARVFAADPSHIALERDRFAAGLLHSLGDLRRRLCVTDVIDRHVIAARGRELRRRCANSAASAGDEQNGSRHSKAPSMIRDG
jgi:hypothetical protein